MPPKQLKQYQRDFDRLVEEALASGEFAVPMKNEPLARACALALRGGKRMRPAILQEIARAAWLRTWARPMVDPADAALAVEYLHAASLVLDDMPQFDNDRTRRGRASVWAATKPAVAQLAAVALVAAAFQRMCSQVDRLEGAAGHGRTGTLLCRAVSAALGASGAAGGQMLDILDAQAMADQGPGGVARATQQKTSPFIEIAFVAGWLLGGGGGAEAGALRSAGRMFGTAFQVADDLADMRQDEQRQKDGKPGWNYANAYGRGRAVATIFACLVGCRKILEAKGLFTPLWHELFDAVWIMARE